MTYFWRLFLSVLMAFFLSFSHLSAYSLPLAITPITASDFLKLGVIQMQRGDYQEAIKQFNQALQLQENLAVAYSDRCFAYLQLQDYHQAIADCTQALNFAPQNFDTYLLRGLAHYRKGDDPSAIADYNQAIALKPDDFRAYYNRGLAYTGQGKYLKAIANYNLALTQIPPTSNLFLADIYNDRGLAHLILQDSPAAMLDFNLAIRLKPQDYRAYFNRGCTSGQNGDDMAAIRDFSQAIRLNPSYAQAYVNRGMARYRLSSHQGAMSGNKLFRIYTDLKQASEYFGEQGEKVAYEKTLSLLNKLQQQLELATEIA
jgi:tetratricopeptide (TPR) repeat protein